MDLSTWIALGALAVAAAQPALGSLTAGARRDGKVDEILKRLTDGQQDHEVRLRGGGL